MKKSKSRPRHELQAAIQAMRTLLREVGGNYLSRLQSDLARIQHTVRAAGEKPDRRRLAQIEQMLRWLRALEVNPNKGKRKDIRDMDRLIARMTDLVDGW